MQWSQMAGTRAYDSEAEARKALRRMVGNPHIRVTRARVTRLEGTLGPNPQPRWIIETARP